MQPGIPKGESPPNSNLLRIPDFHARVLRKTTMPAQQVIKHFWEITTICPRAYQTLARNGRGPQWLSFMVRRWSFPPIWKLETTDSGYGFVDAVGLWRFNSYSSWSMSMCQVSTFIEFPTMCETIVKQLSDTTRNYLLGLRSINRCQHFPQNQTNM